MRVAATKNWAVKQERPFRWGRVMGRAITAISSSAASLLPGPTFFANLPLIEGLRRIVRDMFDPYRPERHYMRGPGPKWRAKHGQTAGF